MTDTSHSPRYRRRTQTLLLQRQLAREAAEAGEPLAVICARLNIPRSTLSGWARKDGFRACDPKANAEAAARAETEVALLALGDDGTQTELGREVDLGCARVGALLAEAEVDMRKARCLLSLIWFAAPVKGRERVWMDEDYADPPENAGWDSHTRMAWIAGDYTFGRFEPIRAYVWETEDSGQGEAFHALRRKLDAEHRPHGQPLFNSPYGVAEFDRKLTTISVPSMRWIARTFASRSSRSMVTPSICHSSSRTICSNHASAPVLERFRFQRKHSQHCRDSSCILWMRYW